MEQYLNILDQILLSDNVVNNFYKTYRNNLDFKNWLLNILPEVEDCENQQQNTEWHKYNVLGHILHSVEEINKQTTNLPDNDRRLLAYTMFLHDIGKPACHIIKYKDGKQKDGFYGHNIKSCEIIKRCSSALGFDQNSSNILAKLVYKHDIFMFIKDFHFTNPHWRLLTPELLEEEIQDLSTVGNGNKLMKYLVMVGRADSSAQNEKMTEYSFKLLDKIDDMLDNKLI